MSYETFKIIWDKVRHTARTLILVGQGESFLHKNIYEMIEYVGNSAYIYIDTNGNAEIDVERLLSLGVDELVFSIDGINQEMYSKYRINGNFDKVVRTMDRIIQFRNLKKLVKPKVVFKFILFKHTEMYAEQAKELAFRIGADSFRAEPCTFLPMYGIDNFKKFMPLSSNLQRIKYVDFEKDEIGPASERSSSHCIVPLDNILVDVNGDVASCCAIDRNSSGSLGNLKNQTLEEIWNDPRSIEFRLKVMENRYLNYGCRICSYPISSFSHFFDGTKFEDPPLPQRDESTRYYVDNNAVSAEEILTLRNESRDIEADYFINIGKAPDDRSIIWSGISTEKK